MTELDIAYFKEKLLKTQAQINALEQTHEQASECVTLDQTRVGRLSRMDAMQAQAIAVETRRRNQLMLKNIERALKKIDADDFGYCESCDEAIDRRRLDFDPTVRFCVHCAEKLGN